MSGALALSNASHTSPVIPSLTIISESHGAGRAQAVAHCHQGQPRRPHAGVFVIYSLLSADPG